MGQSRRVERRINSARKRILFSQIPPMQTATEIPRSRISERFCDSEICLARPKEYSPALKRKLRREGTLRWADISRREKERRRIRCQSEGAMIISPPVVALHFFAFLGGGVCFFLFFLQFRNRILCLGTRGEGKKRRSRTEHGAKIETHRGERYKWDIGPGTRWRRREEEEEPTKKCIEITGRLEEVQEEDALSSHAAEGNETVHRHSRDLNGRFLLIEPFDIRGARFQSSRCYLTRRGSGFWRVILQRGQVLWNFVEDSGRIFGDVLKVSVKQFWNEKCDNGMLCWYFHFDTI